LSFEHITIDDGLNSNYVTSVFKDSRGIIWFGTQDGLNKYDGYTISQLKKTVEDSSKHILGKELKAITEDGDKNLWIATGLALNKLNLVTQEITYYLYKGDSLEDYKEGASDLLYDPINNWLWMGNSECVVILDLTTYKFKKYTHDPNNPRSVGPKGVMDIKMDRNGDVWLTTWGHGISKYNRASNDFTHFLPNPQDPNSIMSAPIFKMTVDIDNNIWVVSNEANYAQKLDINTGKFIPYKMNEYGGLWTIDADMFGNVWGGSLLSGLYKIDIKTGQTQVYKHDNNNLESLTETRIGRVYIDKNGMLWVTSLNKGVNKTNLNLGNIIYFNVPSDKNDTDIVPYLEEDFEKNIWTCRKGELFKYDFSQNKFIYINLSKYLKNQRIDRIVKFNSDNIFIVNDRQIYTLNIHNHTLSKFSNQYIVDDIISKSFTDSDGNLYLVMYNNLYVFKNGDLSNKPIKVKMRDDNLGEKYFYANFMEDNKNVYATIETRFLVFNKSTLENKIIGDNYFKKIGTARFTSLYKSNNKINIYSIKNIFTYDLNTYSIEAQPYHYLKNDEVAPFTYQVNDSLIVNTTYRGIFIYNLNNKKYIHPRIYNSDRINPDVFLKSSEKKYFLIAGNGFLQFDPTSIYNSPKPRNNIIISDFYLFNQPIEIGGKNSPLIKSITETDTLVLTHEQSVFSFELSLLNYFDISNNSYSYILEGFEKKWNNIGDRKVATYTNIPAGKYIFKYYARDINKQKSDTKSLVIIIKPPFWETWWFRTIVILSLIGIIYLIFMLRTRAIRKQKIELEHQVILRTAEILSQKEEIMAQKEAIEIHEKKITELYKDVTDSIQTAQRIQESILPPEELIKHCLQDSYVLYLPKDIVSGDFYWFHVDIDKYYIAAVDCTGHGVAGAFMSLIAHNLLNRIIKDERYLSPKEILDKLNLYVIQVLHQESEQPISKDGMDIAVCMIDTKNNTISYAGANNHLYMIRDEKLEVYKADGNSVGIQPHGKISKFTEHQIPFIEGDKFYVFSDGFAGQFGGEGGFEKMKYNRFREILLTNHKLPMNEQKRLLYQFLKDWMKYAEEQTDDIMVIGFSM
jgi:serine phosphatase RsbU (regulator of sigma subunit)